MRISNLPAILNWMAKEKLSKSLPVVRVFGFIHHFAKQGDNEAISLLKTLS